MNGGNHTLAQSNCLTSLRPLNLIFGGACNLSVSTHSSVYRDDWKRRYVNFAGLGLILIGRRKIRIQALAPPLRLQEFEGHLDLLPERMMQMTAQGRAVGLKRARAVA